MDADGAVGLGAGLGGEIEELDGGVVLVPLVADEGLHDVALGLAGAGDELAGAEFLLDAAADLGHEIVIFRDVPVGALVLELDLDQLAVAEVEDGAAKDLLDEALDGPCLAAGDIVTVHDVGLCAPEEAFGRSEDSPHSRPKGGLICWAAWVSGANWAWAGRTATRMRRVARSVRSGRTVTLIISLLVGPS